MFKDVVQDGDDSAVKLIKNVNAYRRKTKIALGDAFINFSILAGECEITDEDLLASVGEYFLLLVLQSLSDPPEFEIDISPELIQRLCHAKWKPTLEFRILKYAMSHRTYLDEFVLSMRRFGEDIIINHLPEVFSRAIQAIVPGEITDEPELAVIIKQLNDIDTRLNVNALLDDAKIYADLLNNAYSEVNKFLQLATSTYSMVLCSFCGITDNLSLEKFEELTAGLNEYLTECLSYFEKMNDELGTLYRHLQQANKDVLQLSPADSAMQEILQKTIDNIPAYVCHNESLSEELRGIQAKMTSVASALITPVSDEESTLFNAAKHNITTGHNNFQSLEDTYAEWVGQFKAITMTTNYAEWKIQAQNKLNKLHSYKPKDRREILSDVLKTCRSYLEQFNSLESALATMLSQYNAQLAQINSLKQVLTEAYTKTPSPHLQLLLKFLEEEGQQREKNFLMYSAKMNSIKHMIQSVTGIKNRTKRALQDLNALMPCNGLNGLLASPQKSQSVRTERVDKEIDENASVNGLNR